MQFLVQHVYHWQAYIDIAAIERYQSRDLFVDGFDSNFAATVAVVGLVFTGPAGRPGDVQFHGAPQSIYHYLCRVDFHTS